MKKHFATRLLFAVMICFLSQVSFASVIWGTDASDGLNTITGDRSTDGGGLVASNGSEWDASGTSISWEIVPVLDQASQVVYWEYTYIIDTSQSGKAVSNMILEFTKDELGINIMDVNGPVEGPKTWTKSGNQEFPAGSDIYGIKFDYSQDDDQQTIYTFTTDRSPVYGVFFAKGGNNTDNTLYSSALLFSDYKTNMSLTDIDFIVRPNGMTVVPVPAAFWLFGSALMALIGLRRKQLSG